jgi:hypothetical protein
MKKLFYVIELKYVCFVVVLILSFNQLLADEFRFSLGMTLEHNLDFEGLDTKFNSSQNNIYLDYLTKNTEGFQFDSSLDWYWGLGLRYSQQDAKRQSQDSNDLVTDSEFQWQMYSGSFIFGLVYDSFQIELPISYLFAIEKSERNDKDEKYGISYGVHFIYNFISKANLAIGYEQLQFSYGKNSSTSESGKLAYPVKVSQILLLISYSFSFGENSFSGGGI